MGVVQRFTGDTAGSPVNIEPACAFVGKPKPGPQASAAVNLRWMTECTCTKRGLLSYQPWWCGNLPLMMWEPSLWRQSTCIELGLSLIVLSALVMCGIIVKNARTNTINPYGVGSLRRSRYARSDTCCHFVLRGIRDTSPRTFRGRPEVRRECTIPVLAGRLNSSAFSGVFGITQETV
ncbi:hypothetical protein DTO012A7_1825 [Penicillium roqueforti]|nr:hypothetical protein LCP963914a_507 [Penicillium roqueforti]KAI2705368.1 hypothetical protein CBS147372_1671 [Penicillium roqueforti]KAI2731597.1 hypothetical protein CBS147354_706 [Penicillium roqueforti]KAI3166377.1 hypothetical protein CBS147317_2320 [Penicillium roqueforti]KAI3243008.1 hypothetical protein DTO012A7_1825 [Penicillium roqueforti]